MRSYLDGLASRGSFDTTTLERLKRRFAADVAMANLSGERIMNRVVDWVANGDPYDSLADFPLRVAAVSADDVRASSPFSRVLVANSLGSSCPKQPPSGGCHDPPSRAAQPRTLFSRSPSLVPQPRPSKGSDSLVIHEGRTPRGIRYAFLPQPFEDRVALSFSWWDGFAQARPGQELLGRLSVAWLQAGTERLPEGQFREELQDDQIRLDSEPVIGTTAAPVSPAREAPPRSPAPPRGARHASPVGAGSGPSTPPPDIKF